LVTNKKDEQDAKIKSFLEKYPALKEKPPAGSRRKMEEFVSGIVDEKPTQSEAHALAVYIKALETGVAHYVPQAQQKEIGNFWNDDVWRGIKKLWGIGGSPDDSEGDY